MACLEEDDKILLQSRSPAFRSVLPHEPQPVESRGYVHIQGALEPKHPHNKSSEEESEFFWTAETLPEALMSVFSRNYQALELPFQALDVLLLGEPPFTKVRVVYASPSEALHTLVALRHLQLTPARLFATYNVDDDMLFGSRALQATQCTTLELPETNCWSRSNPPKFRRLIARPGEAAAHLQHEREQTRFVFLSNLLDDTQSQSVPDDAWNDPHLVAEAIRSVINAYDTSGQGVEVFCSLKKMTQYVHIGMRSPRDARQLMTALQERRVCWTYRDCHGTSFTVPSGPLFCDYAAITHRSAALEQARASGHELGRGEPTRSECTSTTDHVTVPGLVVIEEFVSCEEEEALMAVLTGPQAPWAPMQTTPSHGTIKRRVQHYGYVFDYETANVLRDRSQPHANCPPMPAIPDKSTANLEAWMSTSVQQGNGWEVLAGMVERTRRQHFGDNDRVHGDLNQMTINEYAPGQGIGSHVDTPSAFGDGLISISLKGGIVMEFRKGDERKLVYLPPRSLMLMSGPARYEWEHMIVGRRTDTHEGVVLPRRLRVSLTLRTALDRDGSVMPRVESSVFPPVWGNKREKSGSTLATPDCERNHVHAVYDAIATQWHHTRGRRGVLWPGATQFLQRLPVGSVVADVGCGDGKYFPAIWEAGSYVIGTDISLPLLKTAIQVAAADDDDVPENRRVSEHRRHLRDRPSVAVADCMSIPLRSKSCDAAICIAVLHHLSTPHRRRRCLEELVRIVRPGGTINVQAWAMEQEEGSRRRFASNDVFVPFNAQPKYLQLDQAEAEESSRQDVDRKESAPSLRTPEGRSMAQMYSEAFNADYDDQKGLVVFQRYCHLYRKGELESLVADIPGVKVVDGGFESGNHFVILEVLK